MSRGTSTTRTFSDTSGAPDFRLNSTESALLVAAVNCKPALTAIIRHNAAKTARAVTFRPRWRLRHNTENALENENLRDLRASYFLFSSELRTSSSKRS